MRQTAQTIATDISRVSNEENYTHNGALIHGNMKIFKETLRFSIAWQ